MNFLFETQDGEAILRLQERHAELQAYFEANLITLFDALDGIENVQLIAEYVALVYMIPKRIDLFENCVLQHDGEEHAFLDWKHRDPSYATTNSHTQAAITR